MKTPASRCLTGKTPGVSKTLVYNHKNFYAPPTTNFSGSASPLVALNCYSSVIVSPLF